MSELTIRLDQYLNSLLSSPVSENQLDVSLKSIIEEVKAFKSDCIHEMILSKTSPISVSVSMIRKKEFARYRTALLKFCLRFYEAIGFSVFFDSEGILTRLFSSHSRTLPR